MSSTRGTKVTTDPETQQDPKNENPGIVTSDSLAAENIQEGGSFAANSDARGPMAQPSRSTNTNTTDTSNATRLDPAPDAEARQASEAWNENQILNSGLGKEGLMNQGQQSGGSTAGVVGGGSGGSGSGGVDQDTRQLNYGTGNAAPAPGAQAHPANTLGDNFKPKGANVTEGGFDSDAPNASFTSDIGGKNDPGRMGVGNLQEQNAPFSSGAGPREGQVSNDGQYDVLKDTSA